MNPAVEYLESDYDSWRCIHSSYDIGDGATLYTCCPKVEKGSVAIQPMFFIKPDADYRDEYYTDECWDCVHRGHVCYQVVHTSEVGNPVLCHAPTTHMSANLCLEHWMADYTPNALEGCRS